MLRVNPDNVPTEMKARPQWVVWHGNKIPCQTNGAPAKSNDPSTWTTFDAAWHAYEQGRYSGIGYMFSKDDPFVGIDLDGCRHPREGLAEWAQKIVDQIGSYAEVSPSGHGAHIIVRGTSPFPTGKKIDLSVQQGNEGGKGAAIEIYDHARYFCITGHILQRGLCQ